MSERAPPHPQVDIWQLLPKAKGIILIKKKILNYIRQK